MKESKNFFIRAYDRLLNKQLSESSTPEEDVELVAVKEEDFKDIPNNTKTTIPPGRVSRPEYDKEDFFKVMTDADFVTPEFMLSVIPGIRRLSKINEDLGSVYNDLVQLTNTGHNIKFDQTLNEIEVARMRKHLKRVSKKWGSGVAGINGLVNKMVGQVWISGALSNEWVPNRDLTGIQNSVLVNPENIVFKYNKGLARYEPYQKVKGIILDVKKDNIIKLNPETYSYFGILGDTDSPYGIPPFMTALEALSTQAFMKKNIRHIMKQLGILGYLEVKVDKPTQKANESEGMFLGRLNGLLKKTKENVIAGFSDGVVVGYDGDHEFQFHSTTKNLSGVDAIYNQNEVQVANGLKTSPSFIGQAGAGSEQNMSIVFTKMLSQLANVQELIIAELEKGYLLELNLAGYPLTSDQISVVFKASTITDDLKTWQAKEIKQRVLHNLAIDGIVNQDQYAEEMTYDKPASKQPIVPYKDQAGKGVKDQESKDKREAGKDTSDRRNRDRNKKQTKRKDGNTKPQ